jgi:hypothetical protein
MVAKQKSNLSEKAMLVSISFSFWTGKTKDKQVTREVLIRKNSSTDAGTWFTNLVSKNELKDIDSARGKVRETHYRLTLPWMDGGTRILPSAMFMKYTEEMRKVIAEHEKALAAFLKTYPELVKDAQKRLGDLLKDKRLPTAAEIKHKFRIRQDILPIPEAGDFRCKLTDGQEAQIKKQVASSIEDMTERAVTSVWEQFTELVSKIEETMKQPKKIFRDSLISNLKDYCELLPKLNLTNDNNLEHLRKEALAKLAKLIPDNLRQDKNDRKKAHKSAKEIMEKIKGYTKS